jgi:hypothetical protein
MVRLMRNLGGGFSAGGICASSGPEGTTEIAGGTFAPSDLIGGGALGGLVPPSTSVSDMADLLNKR